MASIRKGMRNLVAMSDTEFHRLVTGGSTLKMAQEAAKMSPPRTPRGENPKTTIKLLRRTIATLEGIIAGLRIDLAAHDKKEAENDVTISELESELITAQGRAEMAETDLRRIDTALHIIRVRNAYLEGYYAKSAEILPNDKAQALARAGARTPPGVPNGGPVEAGGRQEAPADRTA